MKIRRKLILDHKRTNTNWVKLINDLYIEFNIKRNNCGSNNKNEKFAEMFFHVDLNRTYEKKLYYNGLL